MQNLGCCSAVHTTAQHGASQPDVCVPISRVCQQVLQRLAKCGLNRPSWPSDGQLASQRMIDKMILGRLARSVS